MTNPDPAAPLYTAMTAREASNEAASALACCRLTPAERADCQRTQTIVTAHFRRRMMATDRDAR